MKSVRYFQNPVCELKIELRIRPRSVEFSFLHQTYLKNDCEVQFFIQKHYYQLVAPFRKSMVIFLSIKQVLVTSLEMHRDIDALHEPTRASVGQNVEMLSIQWCNNFDLLSVNVFKFFLTFAWPTFWSRRDFLFDLIKNGRVYIALKIFNNENCTLNIYNS